MSQLTAQRMLVSLHDCHANYGPAKMTIWLARLFCVQICIGAVAGAVVSPDRSDSQSGRNDDEGPSLATQTRAPFLPRHCAPRAPAMPHGSSHVLMCKGCTHRCVA